MIPARRIALAPSVTRRTFQDLAFDSRWRLHGVVEERGEVPYEEIWTVGDENTAAHYIEDKILAVPYVLVMGERIDEVAATLAERLETVTPEEAAASTREAPGKRERLRSIAYLAAAAPESAHPAVLKAFEELLADPDPEVRDHAILGSVYPLWPEIDGLLERVHEDDPEPHIREAAANALAAIKRHRNGDGS